MQWFGLFAIAAAGLAAGQSLPADFVVTPRIGERPTSPGGIITKERIGPYIMSPGQTIKGWFTPVKNPCITANCYITAFEASLEFANGTQANTNSGTWLHHMILNANGLGRTDLTCPEYLPLIPRSSRIFASGNERPTIRLDQQSKHGIAVGPGNTFDYILELMNDGHETQTVYVTIKFEYTREPGYKEAKMIFLDAAGGCFFSEVGPSQGAFEIKTRPWKSTVAGRLITGLGHVHDGGYRVDIYKSGKVICESEMLYGMTPEFVSSHSHGETAGGATTHISHAGACNEIGRVAVGEELYAISYYNTTKYPLQMHDGVPHNVMSIGVLFVGLD